MLRREKDKYCFMVCWEAICLWKIKKLVCHYTCNKKPTNQPTKQQEEKQQKKAQKTHGIMMDDPALLKVMVVPSEL